MVDPFFVQPSKPRNRERKSNHDSAAAGIRKSRGDNNSRGNGRGREQGRGRGRGRGKSLNNNNFKRPRSTTTKHQHNQNEVISSDSEDSIEEEEKEKEKKNYRYNRTFGKDREGDDEEEEETAEEKRLRLANEYIQLLQKDYEANNAINAKDIDNEIIAERLGKDALEIEGKFYRNIADIIPSLNNFTSITKRAHSGAITSVVIDATNQLVYTSSKDGSIIKWKLGTLEKLALIKIQDQLNLSQKKKQYRSAILCLALSNDGNYLASGSVDGFIHIWNTADMSFQNTLKSHMDSISGLVFHKTSSELYSCSFDRSVKIWDIETMGYIDTLYGHQDMVYGIDSLNRAQCVTVGGRDKTLRLWKISDKSQLVFRGASQPSSIKLTNQHYEEEGADANENRIYNANSIQAVSRSITRQQQQQNQDFNKDKSKNEVDVLEGSIEVVSMIDESHFVSASDSGSISIWSSGKKKPLCTLHALHGFFPNSIQPRMITALTSIPYSDLIASGSCDGFIRLWKSDSRFRHKLSPILSIPQQGFINDIKMVINEEYTQDSPSLNITSNQNQEKSSPSLVLYIIAVISREPKLGRWIKLSRISNQIVVYKVVLSNSNSNNNKQSLRLFS